ncbi:MAG: MBL fold metallo-hydrolase [Planctomycetaceae bacterium]|nr:MBL fold metallo-hydrolase [Planctomycetaceae bacterium]
MSGNQFKLEIVVDQFFGENCYLASLEGQDECLVIDPGLEPAKIVEQLEQLSLQPAAILNTHGHIDHIAGNAVAKERWPDCPLIIGAGDAHKLDDPEANLSGNYGLPIISPPADTVVNEGDIYQAAGFSLEVLDTPGHSPGHIVFVWKGHSPWLIFGGDVLFQGSVGRTDFTDGNFEELKRSIHTKLFVLPDDTIVLPGHGPQTTIGQEKQSNPFVGLE